MTALYIGLGWLGGFGMGAWFWYPGHRAHQKFLTYHRYGLITWHRWSENPDLTLEGDR